MRALCLLIFLALPNAVIPAQAPPPSLAFEVASVKLSQHVVGPDFNNQLTYSPSGLTARNVTLKRLIAEAYGLQLSQVSGPSWIDQNEYEIDARIAAAATKEQMALMLRSLLAERFNLVEHSEMREMRVYELMIGKSGLKIHPMNDGETAAAHSGFHFHGDLRRFADLLAVQFSIPAAEDPSEPARASVASASQIPVLDKTGRSGIFDFSVDMHPELGTNMFTSWQRVLQNQLGLSIESRKENLVILDVDSAAKIPTQN